MVYHPALCLLFIVCFILCPEGNAIKNADTPVMDALARDPGQHLTLEASGLAVGLPEGLMGNSEVGHFTIGTGRAIFQVRNLHKFEW